MLQESIREAMQEALKAHEKVRLTTLRGIMSAITNELVAQKHRPSESLDDESVLAVIKRAVKQRKDSIEQFEKGGRTDLADKEKEELVIIEAYLPASASREEIAKALESVLKNMGEVDYSKAGIIVGTVMKALNGNADGTLVKELVTARLE